MEHDLVTVPDLDALAARGAEFVASHALSAIADHGRFTFAVSGGKTPWGMFQALMHEDVRWDLVTVFQVDERIAPDGDPDRNLTSLENSFGATHVEVIPMPVTEPDAEAAAAEYAGLLPDVFDLIHLGIGSDGHTASLVPDDPVLEVADRLVAVTLPYNGRRRMTLTYPALARAREILWLVSGEDKRPALEKLLRSDPSIAAGRVDARHSTVMADLSAA